MTNPEVHSEIAHSRSQRSTEPDGTRPVHTHYSVLAAVSSAHMLNDMMQALIVTIYPLLQDEFHLNFIQIGVITLTFQLTASLLQPLVGAVTDKYPLPYATPFGMVFSLAGVLLMSVAPKYSLLLLSVALIGCGSSIFHPQSSQAARVASGGRYGLAQSLFQIGGNVGQALGPMLAAIVVLRYGQHGRWHIAWFGSAAILGIVILLQVSRWYEILTVNHADNRFANQEGTNEGFQPLDNREFQRICHDHLCRIFDV